MTIGFANDHVGTAHKQALAKYLTDKGYACINLGTNGTDSVDYPIYAHRLAELILANKADIGFCFCGTGNGVAITLNHHPHIRAGLAWNTAVAQLIRQHNNANVCVIPARFVSTEDALLIADAFMDAKFEGGRHQKRIDMIDI
jgi:ribose 5-phosphate isomerase B